MIGPDFPGEGAGEGCGLQDGGAVLCADGDGDIARPVGGKGLLGDGSIIRPVTRLAQLGIPQTEEMRRTYRELIVTTPGLSDSISGAILYQMTRSASGRRKALPSRNHSPMRKSFRASKSIPVRNTWRVIRERRSPKGWTDLRDRLAEYSQMGARFAKWRAVIAMGEGIPTPGTHRGQRERVSSLPALCQEAGLVPVVEPEVLMDGDHTPSGAAK